MNNLRPALSSTALYPCSRLAQVIAALDDVTRCCHYQQYRQAPAALSRMLRHWMDIGEFYRYSPNAITSFPYPRSLLAVCEQLRIAILGEDWYRAGLLFLHLETRVRAL